MKNYEVVVSYHAGGKAGPNRSVTLRYPRIAAAKPRVAMMRAMVMAAQRADVKDSWIYGASARESVI